MANYFGNWTLALDGTCLPERELIGGKAWSIARMQSLGLSVPPAVVVTTDACREYMRSRAMPNGLAQELREGVCWLEEKTGRYFGGEEKPLLVSIRSGAAISMPGMMDTILNLGIDAAAEAALAEEIGDPAFARDTHRRFYEMYGRIVLKAPIDELPADGEPKAWCAALGGAGFVPESIDERLIAAVQAVFDSWNSRRAKRYRKHHGIPDEMGTAVTVQAMVFGNLSSDSGTGVLFSRNPLTGEPEPFGEYLAQAQGEDVVSGRFTPEPVANLADSMPGVYQELMRAADGLERANGDVQDIEFTVQKGELFLLQSRTAKRAPQAAVRIAVDMVREGRLSPREALRHVSAEQVRSLLKPYLADGAVEGAREIARGLGACQGVGAGVVATDPDEAERIAQSGRRVVLCRATTSPDDVHGMLVSTAVATEQGGSTSHAAVVGRALGVPCVVGCGTDKLIPLEGQEVTVDGESGCIYAGVLPVQERDESKDEGLAQLVEWARACSPLAVYRPEEAPAEIEVLDLDHVGGSEDAARLPGLLQGARAASGHAIETAQGVRAAIEAGLEFIVARHVLPPLLDACALGAAAEQERQPGAEEVGS